MREGKVKQETLCGVPGGSTDWGSCSGKQSGIT